MENSFLLNPSTLAFMGDSVYSLLVRKHLCIESRSSSDLHNMSVKLVKATAQTHAFKLIENMLTEKEMSVFKRGRNMHTSTTPKNSTVGEYHTATGLETLFGYLYLSNQNDRMNQLFEVIWNDFCGNN